MNVFSLSFLDVMACGLGAVVLLFMIINHAAELRSSEITEQRLAEAERLQRDMEDQQNRVAQLKNRLEAKAEELDNARRQADAAAAELEKNQSHLSTLDKETLARRRSVSALKSDLKAAEEALKRLESGRRADQYRRGDATRTFVGAGDRQYITGLKVGGRRILILVDASASMLDETIVNVIRRRNLAAAQKLKARKWRRAVATVDWLTTQIPPDSQFQIYTFNVKATPVLDNTAGKWLKATDGTLLDRSIGRLRRVIPDQGTSLHAALAVVKGLNPRPDNVYLLTDGLPTQGASKPLRRTVTAEERLRHFQDATERLPAGIPVNTILFPMEGDPRAASAYWQLATSTAGALLSPSRDWP
jgi:hypothetical protein